MSCTVDAEILALFLMTRSGRAPVARVVITDKMLYDSSRGSQIELFDPSQVVA